MLNFEYKKHPFYKNVTAIIIKNVDTLKEVFKK